ncbi:MAG TPA: hypothetical protein VK926_03730 [Gaiellaceae bacterium]|nr:hypothetical protein [Gaiellaceae bacterium]
MATVSALRFLSPSHCEPGALASPLARALDGIDPALVEDLSSHGKVEIRGDLDLVEAVEGEELVRLSPRRGFLLTSGDPVDAVDRLRARGVLAYDVTGGYAGFALHGERLMRRLTDLDLDRVPAAGPLLRVTAIVFRDEGERFRVYLSQELGHDVAEAVLDTVAGLVNEQPGAWLKPGTGGQENEGRA